MNSINYLLTLLTGGILALMVVVNGRLGLFIGLYLSCLVIHFVGLVGSSLWLSAKKQVPFRHQKIPFHLYLGGFFGVATVLLFNAAYGKISVTALVALGLLGQTVSALIVDHFGLLGMKRHPIHIRQTPGLVLAAIGIAVMLKGFSAESIIPVCLALMTGISVVSSRTINGALGKKTNPSLSAWYNHLFGMIVSFVIWGIMLFPGGIPFRHITIDNFWIFTGGFLGVVAVTLSNYLLHHVSSYSLTILMFVGQIFCSVILDATLEGTFAPLQLVAGCIIVIGFAINAYMTKAIE